MKDLIYVRVLQHDTEDQIKIGVAFPTNDLDSTVENVKAGYEKETAWCGGFDTACRRYWKRIALVDAESLQIVKLIYQK